MITLNYPSESILRACMAAQHPLSFSYPAVGATASGEKVPGFDNDDNRHDLGSGELAWERAKAGIRAWRMFPGGWARIFPGDTPLHPGETVVMCARVLGVWWLNPARIVYVVDEPGRFGFAYGTLPGHAECGEEYFGVERDVSGRITYHIRAFSRPRHWLPGLFYPVARWYQRRFVRDSKRSMAAFVRET